MSLDPQQIELVRDSFVHARLAPDEAAGHFYTYLFDHAPETRNLFPSDLSAQSRRLMDALSKIVAGLTRLDAMRPTIEALALRHVGYGAVPAHYALVGEAMLHMIRRMSGASLGADAEAAWREAYATIADIMLRAAYPARDHGVTAAAS